MQIEEQRRHVFRRRAIEVARGFVAQQPMPLPDGPMIAAASPGDSENDTSDSTASGPRAVGYSLLRLVTCSKTVPRRRWLRDQGIVHLEQAIGGSLNTVVLPHAAEAALAEAVGERGILIERVQAFGQ